MAGAAAFPLRGQSPGVALMGKNRNGHFALAGECNAIQADAVRTLSRRFRHCVLRGILCGVRAGIFFGQGKRAAAKRQQTTEQQQATHKGYCTPHVCLPPTEAMPQATPPGCCLFQMPHSAFLQAQKSNPGGIFLGNQIKSKLIVTFYTIDKMA